MFCGTPEDLVLEILNSQGYSESSFPSFWNQIMELNANAAAQTSYGAWLVEALRVIVRAIAGLPPFHDGPYFSTVTMYSRA